MLHSLQATISRSRAKVLIMVNLFVRVDKVVIGLMFWNFIGMLLDVFLDYLELVAKNNAT
jgi:FMN-dependent NADH-azoreductase